MTPTLRFSRYREIAADVAVAAGGGGAPQVIVASSGMAQAITAEALRNAPRGAVSLRLATIEVFARQVVNDAGEYPRIASDLEQRLAMRMAARRASESILDSDALGAMLQRSYRDVRDAGLTVDEFAARAQRAPLRSRRRTDAMIRAWREYERLIEESGAVDPADVLARAAALADRVEPQIVAGFYDMTGAQLRIVHALAAAGKLAAIYVPTGDDEPFVTRFVNALPKLKAEPDDRLHLKVPASEIAQYETRAIELREVCRAAAELQGSVAITARSLTPLDIHLINRELPGTATETMPLFAHRFGRAIVRLLRMRERVFPRADVIELLRDGFRTSKQLSIDAIDDTSRRANIACGDSESLRSRVADYAEVVAEIESFAPATPLSGAGWAGLLERILDRYRIETPDDLAAADAVREIAAILRRAESWRRRIDATAVIDLIEQCRDGLQPVQAGLKPGPTWAGDVMRFRGRTFDHVFVVRMEDGVFPQNRTEDPLLPDSDRRALQLREIGDGRDEERLLFRLLQDGAARTIHLSVAGSDGLGKLVRPSQMLKQFAIEKFPEKRAEILRNFGRVFAGETPADRPAGTPARRSLQLIVKAGTRSEFDGYLALESVPVPASLSPTQLEDFGECPQKFLLKHLLGVRDLDEPERELHVNPKDKGSIDHAILEKFYSSVTPKEIDDAATALPQLARPLREKLTGIIDAAYDELDSTMPPFNRAMRDIERRSTKRHLTAFVAADLADMIASGLRPREFEYKFDSAYLLRAGGASIAVKGKIDRIDRAAEAMRVIDYKSGKAMRHKDLAAKIDRGVRMQLAMYAMALAELQSIDPRKITGAIKPLRGGTPGKYSFALADHTDRLSQTIEIFMRAMFGGRFPAFPNDSDNDFDACKYCPVNHSCRTKHNDAEKYAVLRSDDPRTLLE